MNAVTSSAPTAYSPLPREWLARSMLPNSLCRRCAVPSPIFLLSWIADHMPIKNDAEREHYLEAFRRAGLD